MTKVPGTKKLAKFTKELRGSFGCFKTNQSYPLHFLNTSISATDISDLATASELFSPEKIDFEELIQRDLDRNRVQKIATDYLSRGEGRVIFFPPLLACVLLMDEHGNPVKQYNSIHKEIIKENELDAILKTTWDTDGFQLELPLADSDSSERTVPWEGKSRYIYEFAATLKINPKRAKLVVLDGQHRLEALRLLQRNPEQNSVIAGLEIPVCIVWAPQAIASTESSENMTRDFRELFVRINSEPRRVSGHFITLLKDDSYAAMSVRLLADKWKSTNIPDNWNRLHLLEWNTREDERADVRTRDSSLTTVSIISKVLEEHLFKAGIAPSILDLNSRESDIEAIDQNFSWQGITDITHNLKIDEIIRQQIDLILIPALSIVLREAPPYIELERKVGAAFKKLQQKIIENNSSFISLKGVLDRYIYSDKEIFESSTVGAYTDFKHWLSIESESKVYLLAVFQQALVRFWLTITASLAPFGVAATNSAIITLEILKKPVFSSTHRYLDAGQKYTRRMLWRNETVNFSSTWAKTAWLDLLGASLLAQNSRNAALEKLKLFNIAEENITQIELTLIAIGRKHFTSYAAKFRDEIYKETKQSLSDFFEEEKATQLKALLNSSNTKGRKDSEFELRQKADGRVRDALEVLAVQLETPLESLLQHVDFG